MGLRREDTYDHTEGADRILDASAVADSEEASADIQQLPPPQQLQEEWVAAASTLHEAVGCRGRGQDSHRVPEVVDSAEVHDEDCDQVRCSRPLHSQEQMAWIHQDVEVDGLLKQDAPNGRSYRQTIPRSLSVVKLLHT